MAARHRLLMLAALCAIGCDSSTGPVSKVTIQRTSESHGNFQADTVLAMLAPFRVLVTRGMVPVSGIAVSWRSDDSTVVGTTHTDGSGIASLQLRLGMSPGVYERMATIAEAPGAVIRFTATATPARATKLLYVSGSGQFDSTLAVLPAVYTVRVTDSYDNPVGGVAVDWSLAEGAGLVSQTSSTTASQTGLASTRHTLGPADGEHVVTATASAIASAASVIFTSRAYRMGSLDVTVATTGADLDPTGYELTIEGPGIDSVVQVDANEAVSFRLRPNDYVVSLAGAAINCEATSDATRTVGVPGGGVSAASFAIECSAAARIAYASHSDGGPDIWTASANGTGTLRLTTHASPDLEPAWSPDGTRVAFRSNRDGNAEIYVMNADGSNVVRLTNNELADVEPSWSPDGTRIVFASVREESPTGDIYVMNADGSGIQRLTQSTSCTASPAWSPDGGRIAYANGCGDASEIFVMNADGSNPVRLTSNTVMDEGPAWSPDGSRLAFARGYSWATCAGYWCERDVWVMDADGTDARRLTSATDEDDSGVTWSPDGRWIAFASARCSSSYYGCYYPEPPIVYAVTVDGARRERITMGAASDPAWHP